MVRKHMAWNETGGGDEEQSTVCMPPYHGTMNMKDKLGCDSTQVRLQGKNLKSQKGNCSRPLTAE